MSDATSSGLVAPTRSRRSQSTQRGAGAAELVVVLPLALLCLLGVMQMGLLFHAKGQANHAAVQAARAGSVAHAGEVRIREAFARGLVPFMGGGRNAEELAISYAQALGEAALARIEILSPLRESFTDYASPAEARRVRLEENLDTTEPVIPNLNIAGRACPYDRPSCNADPARNASGQSLQDANLLKLRITWGIPTAKQVPLAGPAIVQVLRAQALLDPSMPAANRALIAAGRIPVVATALVRMQSEPIRNDLMAHAAAAPQAAASAASTPAAPASAASTPASAVSTPNGSASSPGGAASAPGGSPGRCDPSRQSCAPERCVPTEGLCCLPGST
ncbi:MAG TPA: TadE/TadG family type IV pilus assembly protein [Methylibium sp.]|uniref:TadE/TadG family type IV pilus assembly protein n=1 Tax=Methylibium sp. TaxID=2067992 RepID=UPI002DBC8D22|nr:TadE/TadG family type IV pilus assembly protein [Methylibium sp.]HEU4458270.1 TadE/TadG family type IV pilus assembly protein [Methylibium sp.]